METVPNRSRINPNIIESIASVHHGKGIGRTSDGVWSSSAFVRICKSQDRRPLN